jgi:hypothetical protein
MEIWPLLRLAHIVAGVIAFLVVPIVLASAKGGTTHRRFGLVYFVLMSFATLSATALAASSENVFFTFVGIFSFYLGFSGYRAIGRRHRILHLDWIVAILMALAMLGMIGYGISGLIRGVMLFSALVAFGSFGLFIVGRDLKQFVIPSTYPHMWLLNHMIGMFSSAVAAMTAVSVTNMRFLDPLPRIMWPMSIGIPILVILVRVYRKRIANAKSLNEVVILRERMTSNQTAS